MLSWVTLEYQSPRVLCSLWEEGLCHMPTPRLEMMQAKTGALVPGWCWGNSKGFFCNLCIIRLHFLPGIWYHHGRTKTGPKQSCVPAFMPWSSGPGVLLPAAQPEVGGVGWRQSLSHLTNTVAQATSFLSPGKCKVKKIDWWKHVYEDLWRQCQDIMSQITSSLLVKLPLLFIQTIREAMKLVFIFTLIGHLLIAKFCWLYLQYLFRVPLFWNMILFSEVK
jgi:hypothetical protein